jgi:hypothetical protein
LFSVLSVLSVSGSVRGRRLINIITPIIRNAFHRETHLIITVIMSGLEQAHVKHADGASEKHTDHKLNHCNFLFSNPFHRETDF